MLHTKLLCLLLLVLLASCSAGDNPTPTYDLGNPIQDVAPTPDKWDCTDGFLSTKPTLKSPVSKTNQLAQPFRGKAPGAKDILVSGGAGNVKTSVGSDGSFCVEARLLADTDNKLYFEALDAQGCPGGRTYHQVKHTTKAKPDAGITSPINLAYKKVVSGTTPKSGKFDNVVDGKDDTHAKFEFFDWGGSCAYIKVDLAGKYQVTKFKLRWDKWAKNDYATDYYLLLSDKTAPANPSCSSSTGWTKAVDKKGDDNTTKDLAINPQDARWAAMVLFEDADTGITDVYEGFMLAELEVWGQDPGATTPPPPDKCP